MIAVHVLRKFTTASRHCSPYSRVRIVLGSMVADTAQLLISTKQYSSDGHFSLFIRLYLFEKEEGRQVHAYEYT